MLVMSVCFATVIRIVLGRLNKKLDEEEGTHLASNQTQQMENEEHGLPGQAISQGFRFLL